METQEEPIASPKISEEGFNTILVELKKLGTKINPRFEIEKDQENYYVNLSLYFRKNDACIWDLNKGLLIAGSVGTGKTSSMKMMQTIFKGFGFINTRHIIRDYLIDGIGVLDRYGRDSFKRNGPQGSINFKEPITFCFDDFGQENTNTKLWGNNINLIEEIFTDRYDMYIQHGLITHATCNVNPDKIQEAYGARVRDRLRQMINYITLTGKSKRI